MRGQLGGLLLGLICLVTSAQAAPLAVEVDRDAMQVGETLRLKVTARTKGPGGANLVSPSLSAWQIVSQFETTTFDSRAGERRRVLNLNLQPLKTGTIVIQPFVLRTSTGEHRSEPITITVGGTATNTRPDPADTATVPDRAAFVRWEIEAKGPLWVGQQLEARLVFYYNLQVRLRGADLGEVKLQGFWTHDRKSSSGRRRVQLGEDIFVRETLVHYQLVPIRAGALELPPVEIELSADQSRGFDRRRVKVKRKSAAVPITVKPLPTDGRPGDFKGPAVGKLVLQAGADRTRVKAGEGVQFSITTTVDGMLQNVPPIELPDLDGFRVFPPSEKTTVRLFNDRLRGVRRQSWLMRPTRNGQLKIPSVSISYFDPDTGRYHTARTQAIDVVASGVDASPANGAAGAAVSASETPALRTIRKSIDVDQTDRPVYSQLWFIVGAAAPPALFIGVLFAGRVRRRRAAQSGNRSARRAASVAKSRLDTIARGKTEAPYAAVANALLGYLEARLEQPVKGLTHPELSRVLQARGAQPAQIADLVTELENCDFARFAPSQGGLGVGECVARARKIIAGLEGSLS